MKKLYCTSCGTKLNIKFGMIPHKCSCGAKFDLVDTKNTRKIIISILFFVILMSPPFAIIHFSRQYFQTSIILYTLALIIIIIWYRIVETILIRLRLVTMMNIEVK